MKEIFCDESGFTGENLWQLDQPYFVYSAVNISESSAEKLVELTRKNYAIKASELHAVKLLRKRNGLKAIENILQKVRGLTASVAFDKRFALACKMFEYLFEPAISEINSAFYNVGFHKFVANGLHQ